jgi:hypothetical protein
MSLRFAVKRSSCAREKCERGEVVVRKPAKEYQNRLAARLSAVTGWVAYSNTTDAPHEFYQTGTSFHLVGLNARYNSVHFWVGCHR